LTAFAGIAGTADHGAMGYRSAMEETTESLRQQLLAARENVERQIDKLRATPDPLAGIERAPFGGGDVSFDKELVAKLTETLREIDESLAGLEGKP
jgi:hypothetical protein